MLQFLCVSCSDCSLIFVFRLDGNSNAPRETSTLPRAPRGCKLQLDNIVWTSLSDLLVARRHCAHLGLDGTCKTNRRNLPLVFGVGQDSNGKSFLWGTALFGKGELSENYLWLLSTAYGWIFGDDIMAALAFTASDGASKIFAPVKSLIKQGKLGGQTARDVWHAVTKPYATVLAGAGDEEKKLHLPIQRAMKAWRKFAESKTEIEEVFKACRTYIEQNQRKKKGSTARWLAALQFLDEVEALTPEMAWIYFSERLYGGIGTTRNEGENAAFKESVLVHSKAKLVSVFAANQSRLKTRTQIRNIKAERYANAAPGGQKNLVDRKIVAALLKGTKVTQHAEQKLVRKLQRSRLLSVRQLSDSTYLVTHPQVSANNKDDTPRLWVPPPRQRRVEIVGDGLVCNCRFTAWEGLPCEDALAVTGGFFGLDSIHIRYTMHYYLGRMDDFFFPRAGVRPQHPAKTVRREMKYERLPQHARIEDDFVSEPDLDDFEELAAELPQVRHRWLCKRAYTVYTHKYTLTCAYTDTRNMHVYPYYIHPSIHTPLHTHINTHKHAYLLHRHTHTNTHILHNTPHMYPWYIFDPLVKLALSTNDHLF